MQPNTRRRYTIAQKARIVEELECLGLTNGEICRRHQIQNHQLNEWKMVVENGRFISKRKKSLSMGMMPIYYEHEDALREYIVQRRGVKSVVTVRSLIAKLVELCPAAAEKTYDSRRMWAYRFMKRSKFSIRRITRNVTLCDTELETRRTSLLREIEQRHARIPDTVFINMDQVSVVYGDAGQFTINAQGARSVQVRTGKSQSSRTTVALTVTSTGVKLSPFVIFKGTREGRVSREFNRTVDPYPQDLVYAANQNAWMTEEVMLIWIHKVIVPYSLSIGSEKTCLILDSFSVHLKESVKTILRSHQIAVIYIPGGLTGEMQPLDVGVNAPFKHYLREKTVDNNIFVQSTASAKRLALANSISSAFSQISYDTVVNSFNHILFTTYNEIDDADEI